MLTAFLVSRIYLRVICVYFLAADLYCMYPFYSRQDEKREHSRQTCYYLLVFVHFLLYFTVDSQMSIRYTTFVMSCAA